ncbi:MAG: VCBS repeat-containing protein [Planctomycetes bacterium]|nr:VCBS repeat-containing protein [Planctomycetota bacterium]
MSVGAADAGISDVAVADFSGDGRNDIAVAWYVTDGQSAALNQRMVTIYLGTGTADFVRAADLDLFVLNPYLEALSVFRNGTADIGVGDFDGDGDADLAVTGFFGDELWLIENLGGGVFDQHLRFPFGFNSTGSFLTPPEVCAADFNGDGRDELVYIADPIQHIQNCVIHFWTTSSDVAGMQRVYWEGCGGVGPTRWTRGLAIADFNGDQRPDLCFSGTQHDTYEQDPLLTFWYGLDEQSGLFSVHNEFPGFVCSDVVAAPANPNRLPGVIVTDIKGTAMEYWEHGPGSAVQFERVAVVTGYAGLSPNRGMTAAIIDIDGDGDVDLVTKQMLGECADLDQIEVTRSYKMGRLWSRIDPTPLVTANFWNNPDNEILRPRSLAVADLYGSTLPEVVAGFGRSLDLVGCGAIGSGEEQLRIAVWRNSCVGDASRDGHTDIVDIQVVLASNRSCQGEPRYNPDADLNKDGCVDHADLQICIDDLDCDCLAE